MKLATLLPGRTIALPLAAAVVMIPCISAAQGARGGNPAVRPDPKAPKAKFVPIQQLVKEAGFKVRLLPDTGYVMMASEMAVLPKGFEKKLKADQNIIMLTCGAKTGGIVRLYETPAVEGLKPEELIKKVAQLGIFKDVSRRPGWVAKGRVIGGLFVVPTGSDQKNVDAALAILTSQK